MASLTAPSPGGGPPERALYVTNGDCTDLHGTGLVEHVLVWFDVLHEGPGRRRLLRLTDDGAQVLAGRADHVALNGIDRWVGGVHLYGRDVGWRFDEGTETVVATP